MKIIYCLIAIVACLYIGFFIARMDKPLEGHIKFNGGWQAYDGDDWQVIEYDVASNTMIFEDSTGVDSLMLEGGVTNPSFISKSDGVGDLMLGIEGDHDNVYRYNGDEWEKLIPESECENADSSLKMAP